MGNNSSLENQNGIQSEIPIFVCSTYEDLKGYRNAVETVLVEMDFNIRGMEFFGSRTGNPKQECLKAVRECKTFIGIFGMRYGSIDKETEKSLPHLEYEEAIKLNLPVLIYLIDEEKQPVLPKFMDTGEKAEKLRILKEQLKKNHTVSFFTTPDNLEKRIAQDVPRMISEIKKQKAKGLDVFRRSYEDWKSFGLLAGKDRTRFLLDTLEKILPNDNELEFIIRSVNSEVLFESHKQFLKLNKKASIVSICSKILKNSAEPYFLRWQTLELLAETDPSSAKNVLWDVYKDPNSWDIKNDVLYMLGKCDPENAVIEAKKVLLSDSNFKMREKAAFVLGFANPDEESRKSLEKGLFDKRREVRSRCAIGLARIGHPSSGPLLLKALTKDKSYKARGKIAYSLMAFRDDPKIKKFANENDFPKWWWESDPSGVWGDYI